MQLQLPRSISLSWFTLLSATWLVSVYNIPFWNTVIDARNILFINDLPFILSTFSVLVLIFNSLLALLTFPRIAKPVVIALILFSAIATSFALRLGIMIDKSMIQNVFETDLAEATSLVNPSLLLDFLLLGLLPAAIISRARIRCGTPGRELRTKSAVIVSGIALSILLVWVFSAEYASILRNHRELRFMLTPTNMINSTYGYLSQRYRKSRQIETASDVRRILSPSVNANPSLLVLVIGETARASDFSLNGHDRLTNPLLSTKDILYFSNAQACGTATAVSLPCMFSDLGEAGYSLEKARSRENLIDVLIRAGLDVIWLDNNSGCKGICTRASYESLASRNDSSLCNDNNCLDEIFVKALQDRLLDLKKDTVLVMHMKGSHGPAYFRRYPQRFEAFKPACKSVDLSSCNPETIHNAYDNTILYTDFVLFSVIEVLGKNLQHISSALFYVSDHGESLGENGLYLHGMPKFIAPRTQIDIPIIAWLSDEFSARTGINKDCINDQRQQPYSHDYVFHTILGIWNIKTSWYKSSLDMFRCRAFNLAGDRFNRRLL
ncbi:MAG: phosphoethanolamine--lipid A transferase [Burkholderiales bacterium]|nr:phosphoethanolamine--lipid A transferase [Burkholderiales bacterium]